MTEKTAIANIQYSGMLIHDMRRIFPATVAVVLIEFVDLTVITRGEIDRIASVFIVQSSANIHDCLLISAPAIRDYSIDEINDLLLSSLLSSQICRKYYFP